MKYMFASNEEAIAREWKKYVGYTVRPLPSSVAYYSQWINHFSNTTKKLLYGGTPEIRSIFQKLNFPVTLIDRSAEMIRALGQLTETELPLSLNERFILIDWLDCHQLSETYSCIIGDDAINMVSLENFPTFLSNAHKILDAKGLFICHLLLKPEDDLINKNFYELLDDYTRGEIKTTFDLASQLNFICFEYDDFSMSWQQTIKKLGKQRLELLLPFDFVSLFGSCNSKFYCPTKNHFEQMIQPYFEIKEIFYPHEYEYCLFEPIYILQKQ